MSRELYDYKRTAKTAVRDLLNHKKSLIDDFLKSINNAQNICEVSQIMSSVREAI